MTIYVDTTKISDRSQAIYKNIIINLQQRQTNRQTLMNTSTVTLKRWQCSVVVVGGSGGGGCDVRKGAATLKHSGLFAQRPFDSQFKFNY